jgi:hypothetical protein
MTDQRDVKGPNPAVPDPRPGTTREKDFGRTDRYDNKDEKDFNVRDVGDRPSARSDDEDPDAPTSDINRDE